MKRRIIDDPDCGCVTEITRDRMSRVGITDIIPSATTPQTCEDAEKRIAELQEQLTKEQDKHTALTKELDEIKAKLKACEDAQCPEVNVVSLAEKPVLVGNSCDTFSDLVGNTHPNNAAVANQIQGVLCYAHG